MHHKTIQAINTMKRKGLNPKLLDADSAEMIELNLSNFVLLYDPQNKRWRKKNNPNLWVKCKGVPSLINQAKRFLDIKPRKRKARRLVEPTENQKAYIASLCRELGMKEAINCKTKAEAIHLIDSLITEKKKGLSVKPTPAIDPKAPRKYKAVAIQFNKYEFDRLDQAVAASGMGKNEFIRAAIDAACKQYAQTDKRNPFNRDEPRTQVVDGRVKPFRTIGLQFNRHEAWELDDAVSKSKRSVNSIIREGIKKEIRGIE